MPHGGGCFGQPRRQEPDELRRGRQAHLGPRTRQVVLDRALSRFTDEELRVDRIDRGHGFVASPFVQHEIYREAVYIFYGKLSVYLKALTREAGEEWAAWVG